jgi:hypothetical protein
MAAVTIWPRSDPQILLTSHFFVPGMMSEPCFPGSGNTPFKKEQS